MPTSERLRPVVWDELQGSPKDIEPFTHPPEDLVDALVAAIDAADKHGFIWVPDFLTVELAQQLKDESDQFPIEKKPSTDFPGNYRTREVEEHERLEAHKRLEAIISEAFGRSNVPDRVGMEWVDYPEDGWMKTHMDKGSARGPGLLFTIAGQRQENFEIARLPANGVYPIATGQGDLIAMSLPHWGMALPLFHGVTKGPRRTLAAYTAGPIGKTIFKW